MIGQPNHDELRELLGAYALDAVDADEAVAVEEHLAGCPQCRAEVEQHRSVAALLGNAGATAPAGLWDRIAASLDEPEQSAPRPAPWASTAPSGRLDPPSSPPPPPSPATAPDRGAEVAAFPVGGRAGRPRPRATTFVTAIAAACVLLVGAVGVLAFRHQQQRVDDLAAQVADGRDQRSAGDALADPSSTVVRLASDDGQLVMRAVVTEEGTGYLLGGNLPDAGAGSTYQLWGLDERQAVSLGVLGPTPGIVAFQVEDPMTALAITSEAQGGADQPTSAPLVSGDLRVGEGGGTTTS